MQNQRLLSVYFLLSLLLKRRGWGGMGWFGSLWWRSRPPWEYLGHKYLWIFFTIFTSQILLADLRVFFVAYIRQLVKYLAPAFPVVILPSSPPLPRSSMSRWLQVQKWIWLLITFNVNLCCFDHNKAWNWTCVNHNCLSDDRICPTGGEN